MRWFSGPPETNGEAGREGFDVMPPLGRDVEHITFLQYAVHKFQGLNSWELFLVNVIKIHLRMLHFKKERESHKARKRERERDLARIAKHGF